MTKIAVVGSLNMDLVAVAARLPSAGETIIGTRYLETPGGKGANQAYATAKLGGDVVLLGRVGSDVYGARMLADLAAVGCDVSAVRAVDGSTGIAVILVAESGQNQIVVIPGANQQYTPDDVSTDEPRLAGADWCLLQLEIPLRTVVAAARASKRHGARVVLDPAPAPTSLPEELLATIDILTPNESEAGSLIGERTGELSVDEARGVTASLRALGARTVILKLGAKGCIASDDDVTTWIAAPKVNAVDTTGAGDVFNAALAVALSEGATLTEACHFATEAASLSVTRLGAQRSMPTREELEA